MSIGGFQPIPRDYNDKGHDLCAGGQNKRVRLTIYCFRPPARRI